MGSFEQRPGEAIQRDLGKIAWIDRFCRGFADLDGAAEHRPSVMVTGMPDKQHPSCFVDRKHRDRWEQQQIMPDH